MEEQINKVTLTTTLNRLRSADACVSRYAHLLRALGPSFDHDAPINLLTILEHNGTEDCLWALCATAENCDQVARLMAADFAEAVLPVFESQYPNDSRPRAAIEAARKFATGEITAAAEAAAWAAAKAAAWAASDAAKDASWAAAMAASDASEAASRAAAMAASDASEAAAWAAAKAASRAAAWAAAMAASEAAAWAASDASEAAAWAASDASEAASRAAAKAASRAAAWAAQAVIIRRYLS